MNLGFLFGSGISLPAGVVGTYDITEIMLQGNNVYHTSSGEYFIDSDFPNKHVDSYSTYIPEIIFFLKTIRREILNIEALRKNLYINYEEIYFILNEIIMDFKRETINPAVRHFSVSVLKNVAIECEKKNIGMNDLMRESENYVKSLVRNLLSKHNNELNYLFFLKQSYEDKSVKKIHVFSLNHDLLIENYFANISIPYVDGFSVPQNNMRYWSYDLYENSKEKINLYKLHGSINWYRMRKDGYDWHGERTAIAIDGNIHRAKDEYGNSQSNMDPHPQILVGTFNKMLEYTGGIFLDLLCLFQMKMKNINTLIVSGYGFGDKGINNVILYWIYTSIDKKIILIYPDFDELKKTASLAFTNKWNSLSKQGKLIFIKRGIEQVNWLEIKQHL